MSRMPAAKWFACALLSCFPVATLGAERSPSSPSSASPAPATPPPKSVAAAPQLPVIPDDPKSIDPATAMPAKLVVAATRDFADASLRDVVDWLQTEHALIVLLDKDSLDEIGVSAADPVSDRLVNAPLYLLLNRLRSYGMGWYYEDEVLHITSGAAAEARAATLTHNVGDLLDAGYELDALETVLTSTVAPESWEATGGEGVLTALGDVLFVRQNQGVQREVQALLAALRKHGRQTFVNDPLQHQALRERLGQNVTVSFLDTPLDMAVKQLAEIARIDIRLDIPALRDLRVREREPVTLKLTERKLQTVLQAIFLNFKLSWILRDGVLWVTSPEKAEEAQKVAIYDVRDLCRDETESQALIDAVSSQTAPDSWDDVGGPGAIVSAKPGTLVILQREQVHMHILELLETYRAALRSSRPRQRDVDRLEEVATVYYRLHANVAEGLATVLPRLLHPDSWKTAAHPEAVGEILLVPSPADLSSLDAATTAQPATKQPALKLITERSVLIIRQTRAVHKEVEEVIRRVESGDPRTSEAAGGMGMGGFGGGFFSVPPAKRP